MIAIIMGVYNGEKYIKEQIGSIIAGDCKDWKLFIFDDGSKDNTEKIVKEFIKNYPDKIYFEKNRENFGAAGNFFNGTKRVKEELAPEAEYFCFSDQDDVWVEDKLSRSLAKIKEIEGGRPALVFSDVAITDKNLKVTADSYFKAEKVDNTKIALNYLLMENKFIGGTVMVNKALVDAELKAEEKGLLPHKKAKMHDWWLGLIAAGLGRVGEVKGFTEYYRQHGGNVVGGETFGSYFISRISKLKEIRQRIYQNIEQAEEFLSYFGDSLPPDKKRITKEFVKLKDRGFIGRRMSLIKNRFFKSGFIRNIALLIFI